MYLSHGHTKKDLSLKYMSPKYVSPFHRVYHKVANLDTAGGPLPGRRAFKDELKKLIGKVTGK